MRLLCYNSIMEKLIIEPTFIDEYLTSGRTKDNFIFENCPLGLIVKAKELLGIENNNIVPCNVEFSAEESEKISAVLSDLDGDYAKKIISRDYVCSKILEQLLVKNDEIANAQKLRKVISVILGQDIDEIKKYHSECPIPYEITKKAKEMKNIELNIFITYQFDFIF